ncbi:MAG: prepilin-type N-terminal cleavage/methylation domain-containing protein [Rickettsiales bacterium]|nr:prepilin-type N-terminal cleavage/methylation domain-containing protein [Rickettsiales bacterium]
MTHSSKSGFTLLEISIVLIIIGLIVGGITVGQEMVRSAELQSVATDVHKYRQAIKTFESIHDSLPGDMPDAEDYWGVVVGDCLTVEGTGNQTCNGDGDGYIDAPSTMGPADVLHESWRAWEHLSNTEILSENYTGISEVGCSMANWCANAGNNIPTSNASSGAGWAMFDVFRGSSFFWEGKNETRQVLLLGDSKNLAGDGNSDVLFGMVLTPQEIASLDGKLDDGRPNRGEYVNMNGGGGTWEGTHNPNCTIGSTLPGPTPDAMVYNLSYTDIACTLIVDVE